MKQRICLCSLAVVLVVCALVAPGVSVAAPLPQTPDVIVLPHGSVGGAVSHGGNPVRYTNVTLWCLGSDGKWCRYAMTTTDINGEYQFFFLPDGTYKVGTLGGYGVSVGAEYFDPMYSGSAFFIFATELAIADGTDWVGRDLVVTNTTPSITGRVFDGNTDGPTGAGFELVMLSTRGDMLPATAGYETKFGAEYRYNNLGSGAYRMFVYAPGYRGMWWPMSGDKYLAGTLQTASDASLANVDFGLGLGSTRLYDRDRFSTAVWIQRVNHPSTRGMPDIVLASGEDAAMVDALGAAGLCWAYDGAPLYLTGRTSVPQSVKDAIADAYQSNAYVRIHVVGGKLSVPDARVAEIKEYLRSEYGQVAADAVRSDRTAGANRYSTAAAIEAEMRRVAGDANMPAEVFVVNGADPTKFFDALAVSAVAARRGTPILLTAAGSVPASTSAAIAKYEDSNRYIVGGPATVSTGVQGFLGIENINRIAGPSRYSTAVEFAQLGKAKGWFDAETDYFVTAKLPDALAGGSTGRGPILLCTTSTLPSETDSYLINQGDAGTRSVFVLGGYASVSNAVQGAIDHHMD